MAIWSCEDAEDEEPNYTFVKTFGSNGSDKGYSVQQTTDGGYIITGKTGYSAVCLIKTNSQGIEEWNNTVGEAVGGEGRWVQQTGDGGYA